MEEQTTPGQDRVEKKLIYCVDDDNYALAVYAVSFPAEHYDVVLFNNGVICLECLRNMPPDLLFLDLNFPGLGGFSILELISVFFPGNRIPVVIVSGVSHQAALRQARELNVNAYFSKPMAPHKIVAFVDHFFGLREDRAIPFQPRVQGSLSKQDDIFVLDFEKILAQGLPEALTYFFDEFLDTGLIIDLGSLTSRDLAGPEALDLLGRVYGWGRDKHRIKILSGKEPVLRRLESSGIFRNADLFGDRAAALRQSRIDVGKDSGSMGKSV